MNNSETFKDYKKKIRSVIKSPLSNDDVVYLCIGTDRSSGDSLGPFVGTYLTRAGYKNVYGTIDNPVHAMNLEEIIKQLPENKIVIAINACLGSFSRVGKIHIKKGKVSPGSGVNKELPSVGDYSITGVVNVCGFMEYFVLQNTRLSLVMDMAYKISELIKYRFPLDRGVFNFDKKS